MSQIPYFHIDAFASAPFTGNQAAVMLLDEWPSDDILQAIGEENNFAETAFLVRDQTGAADWELRWFTPTLEIRLCGHATLASGHVLLTREGGAASDRVTFCTRKAGILEVRRIAAEAASESGANRYEVGLPAILTEPGEWEEAVRLLGAEPLEVRRNADRYNIFLFENEAQIRALDPDLRSLAALGDQSIACTAPGDRTDVVSRVFVPGAGVDEDSVTGSAHAALTPFWAERLGRDQFTAHQASVRGGDLLCRLDREGNAGKGQVWLGGGCVTVVEGSFYLSG